MEDDERETAEKEIYEICEGLAAELPHIHYLAHRVPLLRGGMTRTLVGKGLVMFNPVLLTVY